MLKPAAIATLPLLLAIGGCKSFKESVKPIITYQPPAGYTPPVYMTGTAAIDSADPSTITMEVWRVNSDPYPDSVQLFVRVHDDRGRLITNLAPPYYRGGGDYRTVWTGLTEQIGDDGRADTIADFSVREFSDQDGIPYELALALDYSGTMGSNIEALEDAASGFVKLKRSQDRIALVKFDKEPQLVAPLTASTADLLSKFDGKGLRGFGGYSAVYSAAKMGADQVALAPGDHPRAVVLFTDGEDNASTINPTALYSLCRQNNIPIFTIAFGAVNRDALSDISSFTGGRFYQTYTPEELKAAFEDIYRSLRNYYLVTYKPLFKIGKHIARLSVNVPRSDRTLGATAIYNTLRGDTTVIELPKFMNLVLFDFNKSDLRPEAAPVIAAVSDLMKAHPRLKVEVRGHTDSVGTEEYNQVLSDKRAAAVLSALVAAGVPVDRLRSRGFGESTPVDDNGTEPGRARNRRTEFVILAR